MPRLRKIPHFGNRRIRLRRLFLVLSGAALIVLIVFSAFRLIRYGIRSVRTRNANAQLQVLYNEEEPMEEDYPELPDMPLAEENPIEAEEDEELPPAFYQRIESEPSPSFSELLRENPDLIAWINIDDVIDLPVVYRDNTFYLTHDFYGHKSSSGTLFLDALHPLREDTQYLFVHGHAMHDGSMFGRITHYREAQYAQKHPTLTLTTLYSEDTYECIGACLLTVRQLSAVAGLGEPCFASASAFDAFIEKLRSHALYFTKEPVSPYSALLALSTCYKDQRVVVFFRRTASEPIREY